MLLYAHLMANPRNRRGKTANNPIDIHVGNRVRICRRLRNLSQAQLGVSMAEQKGTTVAVVLSRFSSGYLIASLAIKETDHGTTIR